MTILDRILETKRVELEESRKLRPLDEVAAAAMQASPAISLAASVGQEASGSLPRSRRPRLPRGLFARISILWRSPRPTPELERRRFPC